jgi:hypothetical protein
MGIRRLWLNDGQMPNANQRVFSLERKITMNNLYLQKQLVKLKMQEAQLQMEQAHLHSGAGLSGANWLSRAAKVLRSLRGTQSTRVQDRRSVDPQSYQSDKLAS